MKSLSVCTNRDCRKVLCKQTNKMLKRTNQHILVRYASFSLQLKSSENIQKVFYERYTASSGWTHFASQAQLIVFLHLLLFLNAIRSQLFFSAVDAIKRIPMKCKNKKRRKSQVHSQIIDAHKKMGDGHFCNILPKHIRSARM